MNCHSSAVERTVPRRRILSALRTLLAASSLLTAGLALPQPAEAQYSRTLPWNYSTGHPSSFSAYLNGQVTVSGNPYGPGISAQTAAGGSILGHSKEVFSASANLLGGLAVPTGNVTAKLFGFNVLSHNLVSGSVFHAPEKFTYDSCSPKYGPDAGLCVVEVFPVGPFEVIVQAGVRGKVALDYATNLDKGVTSVTLTPSVSGSVYLEGSIGVFVVQVGVGANLTLISDSMPIGVTATLAPNYFTSPPGWGVKWGFNITNNMTLLSGSLYLYADVDVLIWKRRFQTNIFSWPGFTFNDTLYNDSGWVPIGVPLPSLSSLSPPSVTAGSGNIQLTISGSGFDTADPFSVFWDGAPVAAQSLTSAQVAVNIPSSALVAPGQHQVTVANGGPLGGTSNPLPFHVVLGSPVITQINPGAVTAGGNDFTLTVYGASLIPGSVILWNSSALSTTHVSDFQLTAIVPAQYIGSVDTAQISVKYPGTISPTSNVVTFSIFDPNRPIVTQTFPSTAFPGSSDLIMHVVGTGFVTGSVVNWSGSPLVTKYISGVQLDVQIPASLLSVQTVAQVDVINPSGPPSNTVPFTIAPASYTAVEIPLPPGQTANAIAAAINSSGLVAVNAQDRSFAYLWSETVGIVNLPIPVPPGCILTVHISEMNSLGQVVGFYSSQNGTGFCNGSAFLFGNGTLTNLTSITYSNGNGQYTNLPTLDSAGGINDSGQIVGWAITGIASKPSSPALWQAGHVQLLDNLISKGANGGGNCCNVNNSGQVMGTLGFGKFGPGVTPPLSSFRAIVWTNGQATEIPLLAGTLGSFASDVNDFGAVVGYGDNYIPWIWEGGTIEQLPSELGIPQQINNGGDVVSGSSTFYSKGSLYNLNTLLSNPIGGSVSVWAIADNGLLAGQVFHPDGTITPVLLKPNPTPLGSAPRSLPAFTHVNGSLLTTTPVTGVQPSSVFAGIKGVQISVIGTSFMNGAIVYWNGMPLSTTFSSSSSLVASVPSQLIASAGYATITAANPGGDISNGFVIAIVNPPPSLSTLSPVQAVAGNAGFTLTISGGNFQPGSQIYWNQVLLSGTYLSSSQLAAVVPASLLASPSIGAITVVNPTPGGGASTPIIFGVNPPSPIANNLSPTSAMVGAGDLTLTVSGSGFDLTSVALWNSAALHTTYVSPSALSVQIPASYLATAGTAAVTLTDTIPGGWPSGGLTFKINNPAPQVNSVSPSAVQAGGGRATITLSGTGFVTDSQVYLDGSPVATAYVSNGQVTASLSGGDVATAKTAQLTVVNPQPCDTPVSGPIAFTVTAPPAIQVVSPAMARARGAAFPIQITGSGFTGQSVVTWNDVSIVTHFVSATQLTATVPASAIAAPGTFALRVAQQETGGGKSGPVAFTIYSTPPAVPAITALTPSSVAAGSDSVALMLTGAGFLSTTAALWNGSALPTIFLASNQVMAYVPASNLGVPGAATVQVRNPTDNAGSGGGLSDPVVFTVFNSSQVVTTDYTSVSAFSAVVANPTTIGFNGILTGGQNSANYYPLGIYGLTFSTPTPGARITVDTSTFYTPNNYPGDFIVATGTSGVDNTLVILLPQPTYAIGLNYGGLSGSGSSTITLSNGHVFSQTTIPGVGKTAFAGFVSTEPITSLKLVTTKDSWVVLNLLVGSFNTQGAEATPVPSDKISVTASGLAYSRVSQTFNGTVTIQNVSSSTSYGPFEVVFTGLSSGVSVVNSNGTYNGSPYLIVPFATSLAPGQSATVSVQFNNPNNLTVSFTPVIYSWSLN